MSARTSTPMPTAGRAGSAPRPGCQRSTNSGSSGAGRRPGPGRRVSRPDRRGKRAGRVPARPLPAGRAGVGFRPRRRTPERPGPGPPPGRRPGGGRASRPAGRWCHQLKHEGGAAVLAAIDPRGRKADAREGHRSAAGMPARALRTSGRVSPRAASPPARRNERRSSPEQSAARPGVKPGLGFDPWRGERRREVQAGNRVIDPGTGRVNRNSEVTLRPARCSPRYARRPPGRPSPRAEGKNVRPPPDPGSPGRPPRVFRRGRARGSRQPRLLQSPNIFVASLTASIQPSGSGTNQVGGERVGLR